MWILRLALRRPYTFVVAGAGLNSPWRCDYPADVNGYLPGNRYPSRQCHLVVWRDSPEDMERRIVTISERAFTTTVNDIEHIESQSMQGVGVIKVFFHPGAKIEAAVAQLPRLSDDSPGHAAGYSTPADVRYSASKCADFAAGWGVETLSEQQIYDQGTNFLRTQLARSRGTVPLPYGGKPRQIMVDLTCRPCRPRAVGPGCECGPSTPRIY